MDNRYVPAQAINSYIWKLLQVRLGWSTANYGGKMPIIPASRQPEFAAYPAPYICYGYSAQVAGDDWFNVVEMLSYTIYGKDTAAVNQAVNLITGALRRKDDSARDINYWIHVNSDATTKAVFKGLTFQYTEITNDQGPGAAHTEGGAVDGMVMCRYGYAVNEPETNYYRV